MTSSGGRVAVVACAGLRPGLEWAGAGASFEGVLGGVGGSFLYGRSWGRLRNGFRRGRRRLRRGARSWRFRLLALPVPRDRNDGTIHIEFLLPIDPRPGEEGTLSAWDVAGNGEVKSLSARVRSAISQRAVALPCRSDLEGLASISRKSDLAASAVMGSTDGVLLGSLNLLAGESEVDFLSRSPSNDWCPFVGIQEVEVALAWTGDLLTATPIGVVEIRIGLALRVRVVVTLESGWVEEMHVSEGGARESEH